MKTISAYTLAPLASLLILALVESINQTGFSPSVFETLGTAVVSMSFAVYACAMFFGIPTHILLRFKRKESLKNYAICGFFAGLTLSILLEFVAKPNAAAVWHYFAGALMLSVLGLLTGAIFARIKLTPVDLHSKLS